MSRSSLKQELLRRAEQLVVITLQSLCFQKQLDFFTNRGNRFKTAVCSRRAGKTYGIAADLVQTCHNNEKVICTYITLTHRNVGNIIWNDIKQIIEDKKIKCKVNDLKYRVKFENKSEIRCEGAKDEREIEKFRGWKNRKVYIDECQSFRPYLKTLIEDIIIPSLRDHRGELYLTGTPGPVPAGTFYEYAHNDAWENHKWTAFDNPYMHNPPDRDLELTLAEERAIRNIDKNDPSYLRETYGLWIEDRNSLVFKFLPQRNLFTSLPTDLIYIMGIDIGWVDSDAIAILGYSESTNKVYLVEEFIENKLTISDLAAHIKRLDEKYKPVKKVMDAGALGKKIQEEIRQRHGIHCEAAEKTRKHEFIELLNDDLRTGKLQAYTGSRFEQDSSLVQWDRSTPAKPKISDTYHSDIADAVLYAWRECRPFFEKPEKRVPVPIDTYMAELEAKEAEAMEQRLSNQDEFTDVSDWSDLGIDDEF